MFRRTDLKVGTSAPLDVFWSDSLPHFDESQPFSLIHIKDGLSEEKQALRRRKKNPTMARQDKNEKSFCLVDALEDAEQEGGGGVDC